MRSDQSRGFGFIRFESLEAAQDFFEKNYPAISLYIGATEDGQQATKVRIVYSREREDRVSRQRVEGDWDCRIVSGSLSCCC